MNIKIKLNSIYRQADNIVTRKVMDETLLVPISGDLASMDELYTLNDTGAFIWQALDGARTLAEIGRQLEQEYDAPLEAIEVDMLEIMSGLAEAGLIVGGTS
ncbi:MAG: PqqD family protein [Candidatus Electrothrix sp. AX5]|nr:PqqD family protein [Candidatus Electrothrix sp. AX5]